MNVHVTQTGRQAAARRSEALAPTCRGSNFYDIDRSLRSVLPLYMDGALLDHLRPHLGELGELAGGRLHDLSAQAERHDPVLHARDG